MQKPKEPSRLGPYLLLEKISSGGMADIFKAKSFGVEGFERMIAVKRIKNEIAEDEAFIKMFINEAKITSMLQHANIAQIFDLGRVDDAYYIAMEYVFGRDAKQIADRLQKQKRRYPVDVACGIAIRVCEGLDYAHHKTDEVGHSLGIVHRDVSPANILLAYDGQVKLIDFGVAKATGSTAQTQVGMLKGKLSYMAPEQVRGLPADARSDIFSLGICLYEMLTGERLFLGQTDFETLERIRKVEVVPPSLFNPEVDRELETIILRALERNPEDRYPSAAAMQADLQRYQLTRGRLIGTRELAQFLGELFAAERSEEQRRNEGLRKQFPTVAATLPAAGGAEYSGLRSAPPPPPPAGMTAGLAPPPPPPAAPASSAMDAPEGLGWDDEESETHVYDKDPAPAQASPATASPPVVPGALPVPKPAPAPERTQSTPAASAADPKAKAQPAPSAGGAASGPAASPASATPRGTPAGREHRVSGSTRRVATGAAPVAPPPPQVPTPRPQASSGGGSGWLWAAALFVVLSGAGVVWWLSLDRPAQGRVPLVVEVDPADVPLRVLVDGALRFEGQGPVRLEDVAPGVRRVRVEAAGFETLERDVVASATSASSPERWRLEPATLRFELIVEPSHASLYRGDELLGTGRVVLTDARVGDAVTIRAEAPGFAVLEDRVVVSPQGRATLQMEALRQRVTLRVEPADAQLQLIGPEGDVVAEGAGPLLEADVVPTRIHRVVATRAQHEDLDETFRPQDLEESTLRVVMRRTAPPASATPPPSEPEPQRAPSPTRDVAPAAQAAASPSRPATAPAAAASPQAVPTPATSIDRDAAAARAAARRQATVPTSVTPAAPAPAAPAPTRPPATAPAPAPAPAPAAQPGATHGFLNIRSNAGPMRVFVNDQDTGAVTPVQQQPIAPGSYRIDLRDPATGASHSYRVNIEAGRTRTLIYPPN